jgi:uncharacterized protein (TIGR00304 family)
MLILAGFLLALVALAVPSLRGNAKSQGGAVIIIGLFPIVFGSSKQAARSMLALAVLLLVILMAFFMLQSFLLSPS